MVSHPLTAHAAKLIEEWGYPHFLDAEHSIEAHRPTLTGARSPTSYYIRPPEGMSADALIQWFEAVPGYPDFRLTLVSTLGLDTYHQPLVSTDDFARKYFYDNHLRIVRVEGKSDQAIEAMAGFVEALKRPFDAKKFPFWSDFSLSSFQPPEPGRATETKLLFKPADPNQLIKVAREVSIHLDEFSLGREIATARHSTRNQPPELILASTIHAKAGLIFLEALADSLPKATAEEIQEAGEMARRGFGQAGPEGRVAPTRFAQAQPTVQQISPQELRKRVVASLANIMRHNNFADGAEVAIVQGGMAIEIKFPRTASSLWMATSFREAKHIKEISSAFIGVRSDPVLRDGWVAHFQFDSKTGTLQVRTVDASTPPPKGWQSVPFVD